MRFLRTIVLMLIFSSCLTFAADAQQVKKDITSTEKQQNPQPVKSLEISAYSNRIILKNATVGEKLEIFSVVGIRVKEITIKQSHCEIETDLAKGYYIVKIGTVVRKIAIR